MRPLAKLLEDKLSQEELELVPRSYDIIGSESGAVAVVEIPEELLNKKELVAEAILKSNKSVKSVLNKISGRKGVHRLEELEVIAGDENTEVLHKEFGYTLKLDPRKVFFSPRESTERQRVSSQVKSGEIVLVMFSGIGPYALAVAKKQPDVGKIYCVEINPNAHEYAKENVRMNKLAHKIIPANDDVKKVKFAIKFDRIVMPIAVGGEAFLDAAFKMVKDGGVIHFYSTGKEEDLFTDAEKTVIQVALFNRKRIKIENRIKVLPFGVRSHKICLDIRAGVG